MSFTCPNQPGLTRPRENGRTKCFPRDVRKGNIDDCECASQISDTREICRSWTIQWSFSCKPDAAGNLGFWNKVALHRIFLDCLELDDGTCIIITDCKWRLYSCLWAVYYSSEYAPSELRIVVFGWVLGENDCQIRSHIMIVPEFHADA